MPYEADEPYEAEDGVEDGVEKVGASSGGGGSRGASAAGLDPARELTLSVMPTTQCPPNLQL